MNINAPCRFLQADRIRRPRKIVLMWSDTEGHQQQPLIAWKGRRKNAIWATARSAGHHVYLSPDSVEKMWCCACNGQVDNERLLPLSPW